MSDTSPTVVMNASPPSGGLTHEAGGLEDADSRDVSSSRLWLASGSSSSGMNAQPWYSPRTASEAYQRRRAHQVDKGRPSGWAAAHGNIRSRGAGMEWGPRLRRSRAALVTTTAIVALAAA